MNKWERIEAALKGEEVDRVPISLWKHYHLQDRAPGQLAEVTLALHRQFDTDLIKLTPSGLYPIQDWGASIQFGTDDEYFPRPAEPVIKSPEQFETLPSLDVNKGVLRRELEMIKHVADGLDGSAPLIMTIFSPANIALKLCGDKAVGEQVVDYMRESPDQVHAGLAIIRDVVIDYAAACLEAGASGFFFGTQMANTDMMPRELFQEFGPKYDLPVLESFGAKSKISWLHICRKNPMFDLLTDYPVDVIHWGDRIGGPSITEARQMTDKTLAGGLTNELLNHGTAEEVLAEARASLAEAGRTGFIMAPACVIRAGAPDANLAAARQAIEETANV